MQKVVYVEGNIDGTVGGSHRGLALLAMSLSEGQFHPVVVFYQENRIADALRGQGVDVRLWRNRFGHTTVTPGLRGLTKRLRWYSFDLLLESLRQARFLRKEAADIVHLNNSIGSNHSWVLAAKLLGLPCISHERDLAARYDRPSRFFSRYARKIICMSEAIRDNLARQTGATESLMVIYDGVEMQRMRPHRTPAEIREQFGIPPTARVVCAPGNVKRWKGQHVVVEALRAVKAVKPDVCCVFAGSFTPQGDPYYEQLQQVIHDGGLEQNVRFIGFHDDIVSIYNASEFIIHASIEPEPFGRVAMEPMALARPVIGSNGGGIPEIIVDGVTGYLFEPGNSEDLARKMILLLQDQEHAERMGKAALARVQEKFDSHLTTRLIEEVYRSVTV